MRIRRLQPGRGFSGKSAAFFFLLVLFCGSPLTAQQEQLSQEKRLAIEKAVASFMSANSVPGLSAAVVLDGKPRWSQGFGMADLENYSPATSSTLFRLGSISKPISATAVLQLWERGKLDLDAPAQKYCPEFPQKEWPITTRELLGHLGGIRHYSPDGKGDVPEDSARHFSSMQVALQLFANDPLVAKPGTKFNYSTYGYTLIGCVFEGAASEKFTDYLRKNVFEPAGMDQTREDDFFAVVPHRSRWYHQGNGGIVRNAGVLDSSYKIPGGGIISSADDMAQFESAILADRLLKRSTRDLMWTSLKTSDGKETGYGLGWGIVDKFGLHIFAHTGGQQGTSTAFAVVPSRKAGVAVLCNMDNVDVNQLAMEILRIALGAPDSTP
ncbi:MAG TPA: serine hydrolase domain-containing protein [Candidatus Acidoferrum sp.]|nr:serine hydrolase domain-containing protein [Candidatus Acidoferrum sp.]